VVQNPRCVCQECAATLAPLATGLGRDCGGATGKVSVNVVPALGLLLTATRPP
jgi:hypothetical protein